MHRAIAERLTADEKHEVHNARVQEFEAGEISGKEFVFSLVHQCGFSEIEAKRQWQEIRVLGNVAIYKLTCGDFAMFFNERSGIWVKGRIVSFYASNVGVILEFGSELKLPFSLFELRVSK